MGHGDGEKVREWTERGDLGTLEFVTDETIKTEEDAVRHANVDLTRWEAVEFQVGTYQVTMKPRVIVGKDPRGQPVYADRVVTRTMWRVRLKFKRIARGPIERALDAHYERLAALPPRQSPPRTHATKPATGGRFLLELALVDAHFGKLAWAPETGNDYDLKIAEDFYGRAASELLARAKGYEAAIDRILIPIGNDFYHFDSVSGATTKGTPLDCDGRYAKVFEVGLEAVARAVDLLLGTAPVDLLWIPGNHDFHASYHLARTLEERFRGEPGVRVDRSPKVRKYYRYGRNLIGFDHGDGPPNKSLPGLMLQEAAEHVTGTAFREFHRGHKHIRQQFVLRCLDDDVEGLRIRTLPSQSAHDAWHVSRGFKGCRAAEAFLFDHESGCVATFSSNVS